jgi:hypothetical protein
MATRFGNPMGPIYPLGLISVATAGTPVGLDANVPITTALGTPTAGIPGYTTAGVPSQVQANQIKINAPSTNVGDVYLIFKSQAAAAGKRNQRDRRYSLKAKSALLARRPALVRFRLTRWAWMRRRMATGRM